MNNILKQRLAARQVAQSEHPSSDTLAAFAERSLKAPQHESVLDHLAACPSCREAVMLAMSEVPAQQAAAGVFRRPILQYSARLRWASLAAALAVAVGVGILFNEHESASKQARPQEAVQLTPTTPAAQPAPEPINPESSAKRSEIGSDAIEHSAASKPAAVNEIKRQSTTATTRELANRPAVAAAAPQRTALAAKARELDFDKLKKDKKANVVSTADEADKQLAIANGTFAQPAPPPPLPAPAFHGQIADNFISGSSGGAISGASGGVARARPALASANQTVEVLQGTVTDPSGAVVAGAEVSITNVATGVTRIVKSGPNGSYRVDPIPAGIYKIEVASPGFMTATAEQVETFGGASTTENFRLQTGAATEAVEVSAEAPPPNEVKTDVSQNATTTEVSAMPQAGAVQIPTKASPAAAASGSLRKAQSTQFRAGIVDWAISDTGQLQRTLSDGATTNVQPAPGMTVRAVAAEGIEVWAAGTQSDLSAKEWTQHSLLLHSSDAGKTWTRVDGPWRDSITGLSLSKGSLSVSTLKGIWTTRDGGKTWASIGIKARG